MPKAKPVVLNGRGQMPLTAFYRTPPATTARPTRKRKQPPTVASQDDSLTEDHPQKKGKVKENVSPVVSPNSTPTRRRLKLQALGSETNVLSGVETPVQGESSKTRVDGNKETDDIEIADSPPPSPSTIRLGLPTPVTAPKRRTGFFKQSTPTPVQRAVQQPSAATHTPQMPSRPKRALQQPTPSTVARSKRRITNTEPIIISSDSPPTTRRARNAEPIIISSDSPPTTRRAANTEPIVISSDSPPTTRLVPSSQGSQELEINPFIDSLGPKPTKDDSSLFKLPSLPARLQQPSSSVHTPAASSSKVEQPAHRAARTPPKVKHDIVPSSQADEDELQFWSPGRLNRDPLRKTPTKAVPSSIPGEEELVLPAGSLSRTHSIGFHSSPRDSSGLARVPTAPALHLPSLPELSGIRSPSTPKRKAVAKHPTAGSALLFQSPHRTPGADSGLGKSVSPEKPSRLQIAPEPLLDESQTQPESPLQKRAVPPSPASSVTVPESPRPLPTTPGKHSSPPVDESQTQPESPRPRLATPAKKPRRTHWLLEDEVLSSQIVPESPRLPLQRREHEVLDTDDAAESSQTVPESPRWRVPSPISTPSRATRGRLPDEDNPFAPAPGSLPLAEYDASQPAPGTPPQADTDESQTQPDTWPATPRNKDMMRRLHYMRGRYALDGDEDWDMLSDTPLSIPSDFDADAPMGEVGSDLPSPVRDFLAMEM
ncbi:hypothetical protein PsYK624_010020 [Phanerochaete sordida]|uniref:Uncharacterized protein n=1 Tax=Phanerochaete sordida TaxID=48140 RepID=A0A9P3L7C8_9APHY|nr:hypothetical protein PsYK624_010020 [Phanerochaete sordida]